MKPTEQLNAYLKSVESRLRLLVVSRGAAVLALSALVLTVLLAWIGDRLAFASGAVPPLRIVLWLALVGVVVFGLVLPLLRLTRSWVTNRAERNIPDFEQRLLTMEGADPSNPFTELLAEDALRVAQVHQPAEFAPRAWIAGATGSALVAACALLWMILSGPGFLGYGSSLLWAGAPRTSTPLYDVSVKPGDKTVRRKTDQLVSAQLTGFSAQVATLHVKYKNSLEWEQVAMQPQRDGNGFEFLVAGLADSLEYYVDAGRAKSKHFTLTAKDLAGVQRLRVAIQPPAWLGLKEVVDDPGGDIRTVAGSEALVSVLMDRPLDKGVLVMDDGTQIPLQHADGNWMKASLKITKDGSYHVAVLDGGETVRVTDDYFIEAKKDEAPTVRIAQADTRVSPIQEVPVTVEANDDFGLQSLDLHYSVNGGEEQTVPLLKAKGAKEGTGKTLLYLENFKLKPGDLVSMYAEAKDAKQTSRTEMVFAQAEPFDLTFRQSQESGGGGQGGGNESEQISEKQKEAIAATWNQARNGAQQDRKTTAENAHFLSDVEAKIADQAKTLATRMRNREMAGSGTQFEEFAKEMDKAAEEIGTAVDQLKKEKFKEALPSEEKALQSFLRADSLFKDIQVAFNRRNGGGGGQGGASRDLERMLDLELDTEKNQYETGQSAASSQSEQQKQVDEMMQRLKMLAQRQQQLAQQKQQDMAFQQRYEQEMLRREAEQLQRQMEDMKNGRQTSSLERGSQQGQTGQQGQNGQQGQQSASSQSRPQQGQQSGQQQGQQSGQASGSMARGMQGLSRNDRQTVDQAMDAMRQAEDEMRKAVSSHDQAAMQRASDKLAQAQQLMAGLEKKQAGDGLSDLAQQAQAMADHQKDFAERLKKEFPGDGYPGLTPFSDRPRRRFAAEPPQRPTTPAAESLANEKAQMAQQLEQLEQQIRDRARALSGGQPAAANQMRSALSETEQRDLALHMKTNADWIRKGWGQQVAPDEASMVEELEKLSQGLSQANASVQNSDKPSGSDPKAIQAQRSLAQLEQLRRQLERQAQQASRNGQPGQNGRQGLQAQNGQPGQDGQQGQQGQSQQSAQAGQDGRDGQSQNGQPGSNQAGGTQQGGNQGDSRSVQQARNGQQQNGELSRPGNPQQGGGPGGSAVGLPGEVGPFGTNSGDRRYSEHYDPRQVAETLRQLEGLRQQVGRSDAQTWNDLTGVIRQLQQLGQAQPEVMAARLNQEVLPALERLEMQMKREAGGDTTSARSVKAEKAPAGYQDAVAEYFRKLSK